MVRYITFDVAQSMKDVVESWIVRLEYAKLPNIISDYAKRLVTTRDFLFALY